MVRLTETGEYNRSEVQRIAEQLVKSKIYEATTEKSIFELFGSNCGCCCCCC